MSEVKNVAEHLVQEIAKVAPTCGVDLAFACSDLKTISCAAGTTTDEKNRLLDAADTKLDVCLNQLVSAMQNCLKLKTLTANAKDIRCGGP